MKIEVNNTNIEEFYEKAKECFSKCINKEENKFLENEINAPLKSVNLKKADIKFVFSYGLNQYTLEIRLILFVSNDIIGEYILYCDSGSLVTIDDRLIFY